MLNLQTCEGISSESSSQQLSTLPSEWLILQASSVKGMALQDQ